MTETHRRILHNPADIIKPYGVVGSPRGRPHEAAPWGPDRRPATTDARDAADAWVAVAAGNGRAAGSSTQFDHHRNRPLVLNKKHVCLGRSRMK